MSWWNSAMETVKRSADQLQDQAKQLGEQVKEVGGKLKEGIEANTDLKKHFELDARYTESKEEKGAKAPWDQVPEEWQERGNEWSILVKALTMDINTFIVGPAGRTEPDDVNWVREEDIPDEDQLVCVTYEPLDAVRFKLSPKWISDMTFWRNFFWKVRELKPCGAMDIPKLEARLRLLNSDPQGALKVGEKLKNRGVTHETDPIPDIIQLVVKEQKTTKRVAELRRAIDDEVRAGEENAALLTRVLKRSGGSADFKESVYESCKYNLQKVQQLAESAKEESEENRTRLMEDSLAEAVVKLNKAIEMFENQDSLGSGSVSPNTTTQSPEPAAQKTPPVVEKEPEKVKASPPVEEPSQGLSEDYFGGTLPWEDEETTTVTATADSGVTAGEESSPWEDAVPSSPEK